MAGKPRAVLDTNVFVSGLISPMGKPAAILKALRSRRFTLVSSPPINEEIIEVLMPISLFDPRSQHRGSYAAPQRTGLRPEAVGAVLRIGPLFALQPRGEVLGTGDDWCSPEGL